MRSPMTCQASLGVCRRCYGMDLSTGALVEEGIDDHNAVVASTEVAKFAETISSITAAMELHNKPNVAV